RDRMVRRVVVLLAVVLTAVTLGVGAGSAATPAPKTITITASCPSGGLYCLKPPAPPGPPGAKVVWKNGSFVPPTVTRCTKVLCPLNGGTGTDPKLASPSIPNGKTYAFTFKHAGTYRYFCKVHGYAVMHGLVTVK